MFATDGLGRAVLENSIYDPQTARTVGGVVYRDVFAGNKIPANRINSVSRDVLAKYVVEPNRDDPTDNYLDTRAHDFENNGYNIRLDRAWGNGTLLYGRYSLSDETGFTPQNLPGFGAYHDNRVHNLTVTLLNPTTKRLLTETRFDSLACGCTVRRIGERHQPHRAAGDSRRRIRW